MKNTPTLLLRLVVVGIAALALFLTVLIAYVIAVGWADEYPAYELLRYPMVSALAVSVAPVLLAAWQVMKLLGYIDKNIAFSNLSVTAVRKIKHFAFIAAALYAVALPGAYIMAESDDAPGLVLIATAFVCVPIAIGIFAAVVQGLFQNAIDIKSENDLTV